MVVVAHLPDIVDQSDYTWAEVAFEQKEILLADAELAIKAENDSKD
jgi:hypothetical protein